MTRSAAREIAVHIVFESAYSDLPADELLERTLAPETFEARVRETELYAGYPEDEQKAYITAVVRGVAEHCAELDGYIGQYAKGWKFARIDRVAAAVMRVTIYELLYMPDIPKRVAINEAVEIAKKYVDDDVVGFINGILGSFVREKFPEQE